jgi:hypothetical protein
MVLAYSWVCASLTAVDILRDLLSGVSNPCRDGSSGHNIYLDMVGLTVNVRHARPSTHNACTYRCNNAPHECGRISHVARRIVAGTIFGTKIRSEWSGLLL